MNNNRSSHLEELKGSDFQIVEEMPNIRGWKIVDYTDEKVGKVCDMLFDRDAQKVRYVITKIDNKEVLIPIGKTQLDVYERKVIVQSLTLAELEDLPAYHEESLSWDDEKAIQHFFRRYSAEGGAAERDGAPYNRDTFYDDEDFN